MYTKNTTKRKNNMLPSFIGFFIFFVFFALLSEPALAALLEPTVGGSANPTEYFKNIYQLSIGFAGVLAVLFLVIGGLQYIGSAANPSAKESAKKRIWAAIGGLLLALASYVILQTINPNLVNFNLQIKNSSQLSPR